MSGDTIVLPMVYLIFGENSYEADQQLSRIVAGFSGEVARFDGSELTIEQLPDLLMGQTLFSSSRLIVLKYVAENRPVWSVLSEWLDRSGEVDLVLIETKPDKRSKTFKWLQKNAKLIECREIKPFEAVNWLKTYAQEKNITIPNDIATFMVDYIGVDQWRLANELAKIHLSGQTLTKDLVRELTEPTPQATTFELLDAAFTRNTDLLIQKLTIASRNEDPYMFFGLLASQIYALALMQSRGGRRADEVAKSSGVHPYVLQKMSSIAQGVGTADLEKIITGLAELDDNLKSRSVDPWVQIKSFLLRI